MCHIQISPLQLPSKNSPHHSALFSLHFALHSAISLLTSPSLTMHDPKLIILSVGGSLIVPENIDTNFLKEFKELIVEYSHVGFRFVIICGGGRTARTYQGAAREVSELTREDLDWLGIHTTRLNAHLLRTIFHKEAHPRIIKNPHEDIQWKESVLVAAGWRPGCSTDYDAVLLARNLQATKLINLSNIDYVYDKDPRTNPDAKKIESISWPAFRALIPAEWDPGLNAPFDPVAAKEAEKIGLEVVVMNGKKLANLRQHLSGESFLGTIIK